ncbi:hypothetical protein KX816_00270 [Sphingosinicellaceae bacterium]|nr:hypothetical protein KX816_00270 [Sphingosinicellaceae bacterium]
MHRRLPSAALAAALIGGALAAAWPVIGQPADGPQQLLPDAPTAPPPVEPDTSDAAPPGDEAAPSLGASGGETPTEDAAAPSAFDLPAATGAAIDVAGPLTLAQGGYGMAAFQGSNGRFVAALMQRVNTPLASRWAHIVLRRALLSQSAAPEGIAPADWVAWRAALLTRMGEADGAVLLVDAVPVDRFSPLLYKAAGQAHLAAADPAGLCPLAQTGTAVSQDPLWRLAVGMCGGMSGDDLTSAATFDALRARGQVDRFDLQLGERIATLSGGNGRASNIEWETAPGLTPYRFGIAVAAGVRIPDERLAGFGPVRAGWVLRAPGISDAARLAAVVPAAAIGIASAGELVSTISAATGAEGNALTASPSANLRAAFASASAADRYAALKAIREAPKDARGRYAALLETALPAARLPVDAAHSADAPDVIAALLAAGNEDRAAAWWQMVQKDDSARARSWGLLAGSGVVPVTPELFEAWQSADANKHRARLLLAGLDATGRTRGDWASARRDLGVAAASNSWSRAIAAAAAAGRVGEVAVLAATGLQCDWTAVPPGQFGAIVAAYERVGLHLEARLLMAEAATRG